ncbi:MAG: thioredoxin family protein [Firmicutes bacterium]|nr:thioredoxin family protein [Bacillota bacterium]
MKQITQSQFEAEVANGHSFVMFSGVGCGNCKMQETLLASLMTEFSSVNFIKVNTAESGDLVSQFGVVTLPTMILFKDGEALETLVGLKPKPVLAKRFAEFFV